MVAGKIQSPHFGFLKKSDIVLSLTKPMKLCTLYACAILLFTACHGQVKTPAADTMAKRAEPNYWPPGDTSYIALKDSAKLVHIKHQFYRNKANNKLFEKMWAPKKPDSIEAGAIIFFRLTNQDIDPMTFEIVGGDSWFAHDKNHVYNYRGNDAGMFCITMPKANVKYFKLMPGDNGGIYGMDNKHLFEEDEIIAHIDPLHMRVITNKDGIMVKIISGRYVYLSGYPEAVLIKDEAKYVKSFKGPAQ